MVTQKKEKPSAGKTVRKTASSGSSSSSQSAITKKSFPIVGIGASAGGLEALQEFFDSMPPSPGVAFVVVQHLSPDYKSFMGELLARHTSIPIDIVSDNVTIEVDHIYLIPPKMNMTISGGKLHLKEIEGRSLNLPIDIFFRSLAADQESNAIGIILSGTGSDGTLGIRAIKESGGVTMVQDDHTAKFDGMPRSSISTGMVDLILPPSLLAEELANYVKHPFINKNVAIESQLLQNQNVFNKIITTLHDAKNVDFSNYKQNTLIRRLEKRISINRFEKVTDYVSYMMVTPKEISALFNDMLIGVTRFFRDEKPFEMLATAIIPAIFEQHTDKTEIRVWVPACSTGEEVYSIAILLKEYMTQNNIIKDVKIFATDIDEESLAFAGVGLYPSNISADVPSSILAKHFLRKESGNYQVNDNIRRMVIFARHNIIDEPPFSKLDLVSCRNLLIYLNIDIQQKILATLHICLRNDGFLFLGSSESLGKLAEGFDIIDNKSKLFRKRNRYKPAAIPVSSLTTPLHRNRSEMMREQNLLGMAKSGNKHIVSFFENIVQNFLPPSVIIDSQYNILYSIHDVGKFLKLPKGQITTNLLRMLPKDVSVIVSSIIRRVDKDASGEVCADITASSRSKLSMTVTCNKFTTEEDDFPYFLISFRENEIPPKGQINTELPDLPDMNLQYQARIEELEREIQHKNESLQATVEELETSNEELQSSNEELIASNEELQSTNEELQSVNEELYTVNAEHIRKIEELTELNSDYDNLLKNTSIGNLFLDRSLIIRKVSDVATQITDVLASDIGRPIQHLALNSMYPTFLKDVEKVSDTLKPIEKEIKLGDAKWYFMRLTPYRTKDHAIDGLIITFVDISGLKKAQGEILSLSSRLSRTFALGEMFWWEWDMDKDLITTDQTMTLMLGYSDIELGVTAQRWAELVHPDDRNKRDAAIKKCLAEGNNGRYLCEYRIKTKTGKYLLCRDKGGIVQSDNLGKPVKFSGITMNISGDTV